MAAVLPKKMVTAFDASTGVILFAPNAKDPYQIPMFEPHIMSLNIKQVKEDVKMYWMLQSVKGALESQDDDESPEYQKVLDAVGIEDNIKNACRNTEHYLPYLQQRIEAIASRSFSRPRSIHNRAEAAAKAELEARCKLDPKHPHWINRVTCEHILDPSKVEGLANLQKEYLQFWRERVVITTTKSTVFNYVTITGITSNTYSDAVTTVEYR